MGQRVQRPAYRGTGRFLAEGVEGLVVSTAVLLTWFFSKRWLANFGSVNSERAREWPGEQLVPNPETVYTRAITIKAPPDSVWPWIVQFGLDRAGFYSYELLERVAGIPVRNVETVIPEMLSLEVGDEVRLHPKAPGDGGGELDCEGGSAVCHKEDTMASPTLGLSTKPAFSRFIYYKLLTLVPVSAALTALIRHGESVLWAVVYVGLCLTHAGIMNAAKCPHCPYYKMGGRTFACFIWWGTPKLWADRQGPEAPWVGRYATFGMAVLTLFPVYWLWQELPLLLIYFLGIGGLVMSISLHECSRCLNFDCGHCAVPEALRREYADTRSVGDVLSP